MIVDIDLEIIEKLKESGLLNEMSNLTECDFLVVQEHNGKIIGASGIGGKMHVNTLIVQNEFRNKGIGVLLLKDIIAESKERKYPFIIASRDPENVNVVKLHDHFQLYPIFQVAYNIDFRRDVIFRSFSKKGDLIRSLLTLFNSKIGSMMLIIAIKVLKKSLFKKILTYTPEEFPEPDLEYAKKNFRKIKPQRNNNE